MVTDGEDTRLIAWCLQDSSIDCKLCKYGLTTKMIGFGESSEDVVGLIEAADLVLLLVSVLEYLDRWRVIEVMDHADSRLLDYIVMINDSGFLPETNKIGGSEFLPETNKNKIEGNVLAIGFNSGDSKFNGCVY
ncbi:hypothetical protein ACLOJK_009556 [Asimina triloba]